MILESELNARNKITAIGALAVLVLRYSFGIINWRIEEIKKKRTGKLERCYQCTKCIIQKLTYTGYL